MITEDYCNFDTAKLLKEKGFNGDFTKAYSTNGTLISNFTENCIIAPTNQMAMKWLREEYNLHIDICYDDLDWSWNILSVDKSVPVEERPKFIRHGFAGNKTYQEALEEGIKYCLENLI